MTISHRTSGDQMGAFEMEGNLIGHRTREIESERKGYRIERTAICISLAYVRVGREGTNERANERTSGDVLISV